MALFYCDSTLGCWDFDLCKLDLFNNYQVTMCHKVVWIHKKIEHLSQLFLCRTETFFNSTVQLLHSSQSSMICPLWHFHGNTMGSRPSPFKGENQSFPPSISVICYCCSFTGCERIWTLHSTSTRKSFKLWSNK